MASGELTPTAATTRDTLRAVARRVGAASGLSEQQLPLWESLTDLVAGESTNAVRSTGDFRFSAINGTGVPVQFSLAIGQSPHAARVLGEAGRPGMSMPERLLQGGRNVCAVLARLAQTSAIPALDHVLAQLLPSQIAHLDGWTGAMWCGIVVTADGRARARVYLNQRWGTVVSRIARLHRAIAAVAGQQAASDWMSAAQRLSDDLKPYGVSLDIGHDCVTNIKVYAAARHADLQLIAPYLRGAIPDCALTDCAALAAACERLGGWTRPRMIMPCLEFSERSAVRGKVDFALCTLPSNDRAVDAMLRSVLHAMELPNDRYTATSEAVSPLPLSADRIERLQYVSVGCHPTRNDLTVYFSPRIT